MSEGKIAILDFGGQYVPNLERNFKEAGFPVSIYSHNTSANELMNDGVKGIIASGGPYSVNEKGSPKLSEHILDHVKDKTWPMLGICYGHQLIAYYNKGKVAESYDGGEYGFSKIRITDRGGIFSGIPSDEFTTWMSHRDRIDKMPIQFDSYANTIENGEFAAIKHKTLQWYGLQFHPEVTHTEYGDLMLKNFATICNVKNQIWDITEFINESIERIKKEVTGNRKVIGAVSGGVDSTVAAVLTKKAIGNDNLQCIHVDTGLMRKNESRIVCEQLQKIGLRVKIINAQERFFKILKNKTDSDEKRRAIGIEFIKIFEEEAKKFGASYMMQATIQPDVIESTRGQSSKLKGSKHGGHIKLHHNVGGLPDEMKLGLLEPLRPLYKYQVWTLAKALGLPVELSERQPSPGPSAAVRVIDNINENNVRLWQEINEYVEKMLLPFSATQYFSILIPNEYIYNKEKENLNKKIIKNALGNSLHVASQVFKDNSVGVKGDERIYGKTAAITIQSLDKKIVLSRYDHIKLLNLQCQLTGAAKETVRIAFQLSDTVDMQKPYAVLIRAVDSRDFMTAMPTNISWDTLTQIDSHIRSTYKQIGATYIDYTTKPSATIEYI